MTVVSKRAAFRLLSVTILTLFFLSYRQYAKEMKGETTISESQSRLRVALGPTIQLPVDGLALQLWASTAPDNPDRMLVCTFESHRMIGKHVSAVYVSLDSGSSWVRTLVDANSNWVSETSCASGADGWAYFVAGVSDTSQGGIDHARGTTEAFRSMDGGLTWAGPQRYPFVDWTALAVASGGKIADSKVYLFGNNLAKGFGDAGEGTWVNRRAPLAISQDGLHYAAPICPVTEGDPTKTGHYPIGALALEDGSVLTLFARLAMQSSESGYDLYRAEGETYGKIGSIEMPAYVHNPVYLEGQMAVDRSSRYPNRLYVAFPAVEYGVHSLMLATSRDLGKSWSVRSLMRGPAVSISPERRSSFAAVAVNKDGVVGIEWLWPGGCPLFLVSQDGGESLVGNVRLGTCEEGQNLDMRPASAEGQMRTISSRHGLSTFLDTAPQWSVHIAADTAGRFHLFWDQFDEEGHLSLVTATAAVGEVPAASLPQLQLREATDVTRDVVVGITNERFDPHTATFDIDLVAQNSGTRVLHPSFLVVSGDHSDCGQLAYLNRFTTSETGRAVFRIELKIGGGGLRPGEQSLPVHVQVRAKGCENVDGALIALARKPRPPGSSLFRPLSMQFQVLAARDSVSALVVRGREGATP
jgi:hypothetical protein